MKKRVFEGMTCAGILLLVDRLSSFRPIYNMYSKGFLNKAEFTENIIIGDYNSLLHIFVIYMIMFVMLEEYINEKSQIYILVRYVDIDNWWLHKISKTVLYAAAFSLLHEGIGMVFVIVFGNIKTVFLHGYFGAALFQLFSTTLYLAIVYVWKEFFMTFFSPTLSQFVTIVLFCTLYFGTEYFFFPGKNIFEDSTLLIQYCTKEYGIGDCMLALGKKVCVIIILSAISIGMKKKGDVKV